MSDTLFDAGTKPAPAKIRKRMRRAMTEHQKALVAPAAQLPVTVMTIEERRTLAAEQFHDSYIKMAKELPSITKDGKIQIAGAKPIRFASFENLHDAVNHILLKHGFRISFHGEVIDDKFYMRTVLRRGLYGEDSLWPVDRTPVSKAMNPSQATGSGATYACRYGMMRLLNLNSHAPDDRDTDAAVPEKAITPAQAKKFNDRINAVKKPEELRALIKQHYHIDDVAELPASLAKKLDSSLTTYEARQ